MSTTTLMGSVEQKPTTNQPPAEQDVVQSEVPEWLSSIEDLPDDIRMDPSLKPISSVQSLLKSYINAQKLVGADKLVIPGKDADEDAWRGVFQKLGAPETPEGYGIEAPEGLQDENDYFSNFLKTAQEAGILPQQAKKMAEFQAQFNVDMAKEMEARELREIEEEIEAFKAEEGEKFNETAFNAKLTIQQFDEDGSFTELVESDPKFGNNAKLIRFLAKIAGHLTEDTFRANATSNIGTTAEEADQKIKSIMSDLSGPYYNADHLEHKQAVKEVNRLTALLEG